MTTPPKPRKPKRKPRPGPDSPLPAGKDPSWRSEGWQPDFDVASLADYVSDVVLAHTRDAIIAGRRSSGGEQPPLDPKGARGRKAAKGRRPRFRAVTGRKKGLPYKIRRGKIKVGGTTRASGPTHRGQAPSVGTPTSATVFIRPSKATKPYVAREAQDAKGAEFFSAEGEVVTAVNKAVAVWLKAALAGTPPEPSTGEHDADQV